MSNQEIKKEMGQNQQTIVSHSENSQNKENIVAGNHVTMGIMGNVDSGKSTLTGHMAWLTKHFDAHARKKW